VPTDAKHNLSLTSGLISHARTQRWVAFFANFDSEVEKKH
jgi:hypothetical protein